MIDTCLSRLTIVCTLALAACGNGKEAKKTGNDGDETAEPAKNQKPKPSADATASATTARSASASAAPTEPAASADMVEVSGASIDIVGFNDKPSRADVKTFSIDRTEVSVADYRKCVTGGSCKSPPDTSLNPGGCNFQKTGLEDHPMNCIVHQDAEAYCKSLGKRLPTLEEWELAAAGPENRPFPWGNEKATKDIACYYQTGGTCKIGSHPKGNTPSGIEDMAGNVYEETAVQGCIGTPPAGTPCTQPFSQLMGGTWNKFDSDGIKSKKVGQNLGTPPEAIGFRCAK